MYTCVGVYRLVYVGNGFYDVSKCNLTLEGNVEESWNRTTHANNDSISGICRRDKFLTEIQSDRKK